MVSPVYISYNQFLKKALETLTKSVAHRTEVGLFEAAVDKVIFQIMIYFILEGWASFMVLWYVLYYGY